jgi:DedD protein
VDILLKQRLVGAIVLISLAVIFLPMLFTGKDEQEQKFESSIPAEPVYEIKSPQVSVPLPLPNEALEKVPLREPVSQEKPVPAKQTAEQPAQRPDAAAKPPAKAPQPVIVLKPDSMPEPIPETMVETETKPKPKPESTPSSKPEPRADEAASAGKKPAIPAVAIKPSDVTGWVVQVGSFSKQSNAKKLRDKLRKMSMASFVVTGVSDDKTVYRVRVGPEINRADAEKLQATIKKKTKLNGLVMKYP